MSRPSTSRRGGWGSSSASRRRVWRSGAGLATVAASLTLLSAAPAGAATPPCTDQHWVGAFEAPPTDAIAVGDASLTTISLPGAEQTYRMIVVPHLTGSTVRVRLTNRFGSGPVTFDHVTVADAQADGADVRADSLRQVRFGGGRTIRVEPGKDVLSDPVEFPVSGFKPVAVNVYVKDGSTLPTRHWISQQTSYLTPPGAGDQTESATGTPFTQSTTSTFYVNGLDVMASRKVGSVVAFGDSITDGFSGTTIAAFPTNPETVGTNVRYTDVLQRRITAAGLPLSVINAGIGGNRLLSPGLIPMFGAKGLDRLEDDALRQSGVTTAIVLIGINDLGLPLQPTTTQMIAGYTQVIERFHAAGIKVLLGTIMPATNAILDGFVIAPTANILREEINRWIRSQKLSDGFVDFDEITRDPQNPAVLRPAFAGPDNLHPSPAGYRAMGEGIDLSKLAVPSCSSATPARFALLGRRASGSGLIRLRVRAPAAGTVRVRGRARVDAQTRTIVSVRLKVGAGRSTISVRLSPAARRELARTQLRTRLRITFSPAEGARRVVTSKLTIRRR